MELDVPLLEGIVAEVVVRGWAAAEIVVRDFAMSELVDSAGLGVFIELSTGREVLVSCDFAC